MTLFEQVMSVRRVVVFHKIREPKKAKGSYGSVSPESGGVITINLALHERKLPERTFFHEILHILYPLASERTIRTIEEHEWHTLTAKQRFLLARKLYNRKWRA